MSTRAVGANWVASLIALGALIFSVGAGAGPRHDMVPRVASAPTPSAASANPQAPDGTTVIAGNTAPIVINDNASAALYPSVATVTGVTPSLTRLRVQLTSFTHTFPDDVDIILEGPQGQRAVLMSDAGAGIDVSGIDLIFDPNSTNVLPNDLQLATGTTKPANYSNDTGGTDLLDTFPAPFAAPNALVDAPADLSVFNLTNPNGEWKLYVVDDATQDTGTISGGWLLFITVPTIFTVNSIADPGNGVCDDSECTLREAINAAITGVGNGDQINFSALFNAPQTIELQTALPNISEALTINGPGANLLTVQRAFNAVTAFTVFTIPGGIPQVDIRGMTISNGDAGSQLFGGGISSDSKLLLTQVHVTGNRAANGGGVALAFADGVFTGCTFSGNTSGDGAGISYQGDSGKVLRLVNSTISANRGVGVKHFAANARLDVVGSTIVDNSADGILTASLVGNTSTTTLRNSVIANNATNFAIGGTGTQAVTSLGFNLSNNYNGVVTPLASDITTATPRLGPLSLGGGTTPTHALLGGSPALNAGDASGQALDQRGQPRVFGASADIGAVEMRSIIVSTTANAGAGSLNQAITDANINGPGLDDIVFAPALDAGSTINLTSALPTIISGLTVNGFRADRLEVRRNVAAEFRVFNVSGSVAGGVAIRSMTIANGRATGGGDQGGGILSQSDLYLTNVHVTGNVSNAGGGVSLSDASGVFAGCTFSGNLANLGGGISYGASADVLRLAGSTVSGNDAFAAAGLAVQLTGTSSRLELIDSTIANNVGTQSGGIRAVGVPGSAGTTTALRNTIIAGNTPDNFITLDNATITSRGFNLSNNYNGVLAPTATDITSPNSNLGPLADNGGPTPTRALLFGSAALDAGSSVGSGRSTDQRGSGFTRPIDLAGITNAAAGDGSDIGAFEAQSAPAAPVPPTVIYTPTAASTIVFPAGPTGAATSAIGVSSSGGTAPGTVNLGSCSATAGFTISNAPINLTGTAGGTQINAAINLSCTRGASLQTGTLSCTETPNPGSPVARSWTLNCPVASATISATLYGLTQTNSLVTFNAATLGTVSTVALTGLIATEKLVAIDTRVATGELYGLGLVDDGATRTARIYRINPVTGAATVVSATPWTTNFPDTDFNGFNFDPITDVIRVTSREGPNFRVNPVSGALIATDSNLSRTGINGVSYSNNDLFQAGRTLYGLDFNNDQWVTIGGLNGAPSPNGGVVSVIGSTGIVANDAYGLEIIAANGVTTTGVATANGRLYTVNLSTGAFTEAGPIGAGNLNFFGLTASLCAPVSALSPTGTSAGIAGGAFSVGITASACGPWRALSNDPWLSITGANTGSGNGSLNYSVAANPGAARTGSITISGRVFTVSQAGSDILFANGFE